MSDSHRSRRKLFAHSAHKTIGVSTGFAAFRACDPTTGRATADRPDTPLRVCPVWGATEYRPEQALTALQEYLESDYDVRCSRAWGEVDHDLQWPAEAGRPDCMLLVGGRIEIAGEPLDRVKEYCLRGGSIVGLGSTGKIFENWPEFDEEILGGDVRGDWGDEHEVEVRIVEEKRGHPILQGVRPFVSSGCLYRRASLAPDAAVLLTGTATKGSEPVAWSRRYRGGRFFCTSLGSLDDFSRPDFLRLLANALFWTTRPRW